MEVGVNVGDDPVPHADQDPTGEARQSPTGGRRGTFTHGVLFGALSFVVLAVIGVVNGILVARLYGIEVVGAYAVAYAPVAICAMLSTAQEQIGLVRQIAVARPR